MQTADGAPGRLPTWLKVRLTTGPRFNAVRNRLRESGLHTVCEGADCPNRNECWNAGTATALILGDRCTRTCRFCNIAKGLPQKVDEGEPRRVAAALAALGLSYAVVTSVTRDDLPDGGAAQFAATIRAIRSVSPECRVEVLVPDLGGSGPALDRVLEARPDVLNHNIETVPSLYRCVRPEADYVRSISVLARAAEKGVVTKSGIMVGLGETLAEVRSVLADLRKAGCAMVTIGQYLQPRKDLLPVARYYHPDEFAMLRQEGLAAGLREVMAGPLVRSSYRAASVVEGGLPRERTQERG